MMRAGRTVRIVAVCAAIGAFFFVTAGAKAQDGDDERERLHREAYVATVKAEQARDEGSIANAVELYAAALDMYRQIAGNYPGWRSSIVEARIPYCINELKSLLEREDMKSRFGEKLRPLMEAPVPRYVAPKAARKPVSEREPLAEPAGTAVDEDAAATARSADRVRELLQEEEPSAGVKPSGVAVLEEEVMARSAATETTHAERRSAESTKAAVEAARAVSRGQRESADSTRELKRLKDSLARRERDVAQLQERCDRLQDSYNVAMRSEATLKQTMRASARPKSTSQRERDLEKELEQLRSDMFQMAKKQVSAARGGTAETGGEPALGRDVSELEQECADLRASNEELKERYQEAMGEKAAFGSAREKDLTGEIERLRAQLHDATGKQAKAPRSGDESEALREELASRTSQYNQLRAVSVELKRRYDELQKQKETSDRVPAGSTSASTSSSREKSLMNEIAKLRAELFEMASRESGGASSVDKRGRESKESKRQQSSEYTDKRYDVLRAEYDRVLKENKELKSKLASGSKREQPRVRADASSQTSTAPARTSARSSAPTKAVASVSTRTAAPASTRTAAPARTATVAVAPAPTRTRAATPTVTATAAPVPVKIRTAEPEVTEQNGTNTEAVRLMREGKTKEAKAMLDVELAKLPDDPGLLYLYGMVYCREGDFVNAAKVLKHVVDADQSNARARVALGGAYLAMHDYVNARMELEMAVGFDPDLAEAHYDLAQVLLVGTPSDPEGARDRYYEALKLGSQPDPAFEARLSRALPAKTQDK